MNTQYANAKPTEQGGALPYIFGWLMGVPVSVLLLIALFRSVF